MRYFKRPANDVFGYDLTQTQLINLAIANGWQEVTGSWPPPAPPPPPAIPTMVTMRQARLALLRGGLLSQVDAAIAALPSPQKEEAEIEWEYSQEVHRDRALVQMLAPALGLTESDLDDLFIMGATL
jgi:hypothetical protein